MISLISETNELGDTIGVLVLDDGRKIRAFSNVENFVLWLFRYRCVGLTEPCYKRTTEINEIEPRSSGQEAMNWKNRVPLCHEHHMQYHAQGTSQEAVDQLKQRRVEYLEAIGREEYI